jgi:hypothetical protein
MVQQAAAKQDAADALPAATHAADAVPVLSWPGAQPPQGPESHASFHLTDTPCTAGYGILFFYQLGILSYLERAFDLTQCTHVGSSAGSMLSVLAACNVEPQVCFHSCADACGRYACADPLSHNTAASAGAPNTVPLFLQAALDLAHQLCIQHHVFERPLGLVGIWGGIVREWLDTQLPADASDR